MDSPSDLSPNAPPAGIEDPANFFKNLQGQSIPSQPGPASTEGSVDSSGFEKVDHDVLEEYGHNFAQQMQQSIFGQLPEDPDIQEETDGFVLVQKRIQKPSGTMQQPQIELLYRIPGEIDKPYPPEGSSNYKPHEEVAMADKHDTGDLIDIPRNSPPPPVHEPHAHSPAQEHHDQSPAHEHHHEPLPVHDPHSPVHEPHVHSPVHEPHSHSPVHEAHAHSPNDPLDHSPISHRDDFPKRSESPLIPEPAPTREPVREHDYEAKHEEHKPSAVDDLLDFGETAKELVDEAVREADTQINQAHHGQHDFGERIDDIHNEVDDLIEQMNENDDFQEEVSTRRRTSQDSEPEPDFRHTPEPEETTYERNGPLTIPEIPERNFSDHEDIDDVPPPPSHPHHHGFETEPRPPTPPKDISDEDVKPSLVNLGHGHATHTHSDCRHSILKHSAEPWIDFKTVDPRILDLVYWRDPKKSGIALSLSLLAVFIFAKYPLLSIVSYTGLAVLAGTLGFRIFKAIEGQIKKTGGENPFQDYLNKDLSVPQDKVHAQVDVLSEHAVLLANKAKKLVFVENIVDSVKFVLILWSLTYVSAWFSGFGLVVLTILGIFSIPKVYETYQEPIDAQLELISGHINNVLQLVEEKLPFLKRAAVEVEKKDQ